MFRWPRFSRYQIRDGRIAPTRSAKIEWYDPWQEYREARAKREQPPYLSLVSLYEHLKPKLRAIGWTGKESRSRLLDLPGEICDDILSWSSRYGLLGVFHQRTIQIDDPGCDRKWTLASAAPRRGQPGGGQVVGAGVLAGAAWWR